MLLLDLQHCEGRKFIHEHPARAISWQASRTIEIAEKPGVFKTDFDQCMVGLISPGGKPMKKRTTFMHNIPELHLMLQSKQCTGDHEHEHIQGCEMGRQRSEWAQSYPSELVNLICSLLFNEFA